MEHYDERHRAGGRLRVLRVPGGALGAGAGWQSRVLWARFVVWSPHPSPTVHKQPHISSREYTIVRLATRNNNPPAAHPLAQGFSAHWVRFVPDVECNCTAQLTYT